MAESNDFQKKLRQLGVVRGARHLKPAPTPAPTDHGLFFDPATETHLDPLTKLLPGSQLVETAVGQCLIYDKLYPLQHHHGRNTLQTLLRHHPAQLLPALNDSRFQEIDFTRCLFLDTETTGLAGASTLAFMVGVAFFTDNALVSRQYFVPDLGDEPAMLALLDELLQDKQALVTFNGRSFDIPLLDNRYLLNRRLSQLREMPHLDLLAPARRLWRARLGSVALSALESPLLGVDRSHEDVPGWLIPALYRDYLRTGDGRPLLQVFYHNQIDLLSMVTLASQIIRFFSQPQPDDHPIDLFSLGRWQADLGLTADAEQSLRWAAEQDLPLALYHQNLTTLGWLLKRHGRHDEAVPLWQQLATTSFDNINGHIELAKYYEWHANDIAQALYWTNQAATLIKGWPPHLRRTVQAELEHRHGRLRQKQ